MSVERCCGLQVHKRTVVAGILLSQADGTMRREVHTFGTMTAELRRLHDYASRALDRAETEGDNRAVFLGVDTGGRSIERLLKLTVLSSIEERLNAVEAERAAEHEHVGERRDVCAESASGRS